MIRPFLLCFLAVIPLSADPAFLDQASRLLSDKKLSEAGALAQAVLATSPDDSDALVIAGTVVLYQKLEVKRDDSIFHPEAAPTTDPVPGLTPTSVDSVASYWKRVPAVDPSRAYLWGDLAQLTFRSGDPARAMEYALKALAATQSDPDSLRAAAMVFALNLDAGRASLALARIPGNRSYLLYQGLEAWRTGKDGWKIPMKAFVDDHGDESAGAKLAAFLLGPAMRDSETGFLEAMKSEDTIAVLVVDLKYVDRYPNKFSARLNLGRSLNQFGSFAQALVQFDEIDRRGLASTSDERQAVLFQQAWAQQASGRLQEASRLWEMLSESKDFYLRSAASWFLGNNALVGGKISEAKDWWRKVADEPARSKFAWWAEAELKKLPKE